MKVRIDRIEKKVVKWFLLSITAVMVIIFSGFGEETEVSLTEDTAVTDESVLSSIDPDIEVLLNEEESAGVPSIQSIRFGENSSKSLAKLIRMGASLVSYRFGYQGEDNPVRDIQEISSWWEKNKMDSTSYANTQRA